MERIDLVKTLKDLYQPSKSEVSSIKVPPMNFLMVDGEGDPNSSQAYQEAIEALFSSAYGIKFAVKKSPLAIDFGVMPLEGLWWADDMLSFETGDKSSWKWTAMIMQPDFVTADLVGIVLAEVRKKKNLPALSELRFESFDEGESVQIMHIGPFSAEGPTIQRLHEFIAASGHTRSGKHHEIYLSDFRKAAPEKLRTIIRQPLS
jgi:hypothetical protein